MHTDGFGGKSAGQEGGTSPEGGPDGHRTLARVTTYVGTCPHYSATSHHTVDETASVCCLFSSVTGALCQRLGKGMSIFQTRTALPRAYANRSRPLSANTWTLSPPSFPQPECITSQPTTPQPHTPFSQHHFPLQLHPQSSSDPHPHCSRIVHPQRHAADCR